MQFVIMLNPSKIVNKIFYFDQPIVEFHVWFYKFFWPDRLIRYSLLQTNKSTKIQDKYKNMYIQVHTESPKSL